MQDRPNYQYNDYNSLKDPNQQGQNPNKQGKKLNQHKNYKGGYNKNNNIDEMNLNNNDHNQNYRHRYPGTNYRDMGNKGNPQTYKRKKGKKQRDNDFQYPGNNAIEINPPMKEDFIDQNNNINLGGNNHPNMYGKNYKKNQNNIFNNNNLNLNNNVINNSMNNMNMNTSLGSMNSNTNSTGTSNLSNLNLTPQSKKQITSPLSYNSNSPLNPKMQQQNIQNTLNQNIYINPKISLDSLRKKTDNEQDMNLKDEKLGENLSEENMKLGREFQPGNKMGGNTMGNLGNNLNHLNNNLNSIDLNKNQNDFINQQEYMNQMNQKFIPQQNNFYIPYNNLNGINNIGNAMENMGNLNNLNSMNNINNGNYPPIPNLQPYTQSPIPHMGSSVPNINNLSPIPNLSFNSFQRHIYENQNNNKIFNPNRIQPNFNYTNKKNNPNNSPLEASNLTNNSMNLGNNPINNLNYNGPKNNFIKNQNNNIQMKINNKSSQSSKGAKNTIPNFDGINMIQNQNQNLPQMMNMNFGQINNGNYFIQQNIPRMRNNHMNQGFMNNNHINMGNNPMNNKDFQNPNFNPNMVNNKQKYQNYNPNAYQGQKHNNNMSNNQMYQNNKKNISNTDFNKTFKTGNDNNNFMGAKKMNYNLEGNNQNKQYILCINIKFGDKEIKTINIKNLKESQSILDELVKDGKIRNEKEKRLIMDKINKTYELIIKGRIYEFGIKKCTYKNLSEISHQLNYENNYQQKHLKKNKVHLIKKNKSFRELSNILNEEKKLNLDNVRNVGSLNLSF